MKTKITKKMVAFGMVMTMLFSMALVASAQTLTKQAVWDGPAVTIKHWETYKTAGGSTTFTTVTDGCSTSVKVNYKIRNVNNSQTQDLSASNGGTVSASKSYTVPSGKYQVVSSSTYHTYARKGKSGHCNY